MIKGVEFGPFYVIKLTQMLTKQVNLVNSRFENTIYSGFCEEFL